ncbi:hypothetical protein ACJMK2_023304 [Sinanodonta woodiana]|uniref:DEP domain-containing protein n=1 Tax=Sinanodonta woodiana TaxID=1069815 RepID=A0ABD3T4Q3_SINWO
MNGTDHSGDVSIDNLYPAIIQCFAVILAGYIAGRAGIITSVQGKGIVQSLYQNSHPDYLSYIYLVAPISLVLLNPIGFTMMEISRRESGTATSSRKIMVVLHIMKDVLFNPIVFMTVIGIVGNFIFQRHVPYILNDILEVLGNAFSATALFYLGISLVGRVQGTLGLGLVVPMLLIAAKCLMLPLVTWQVVGMLENGNSNDSRSLSMYGFLYGTFPSAPSVFLYASQFSIATDVIATGMVSCTFLSAPLMFVSAKMMTVVVSNEMDYKNMLQTTSFDVSIIGLVCGAWVLGLMVLSRKYRRIPHLFLVCLVISQMMGCVGMIIYNGMDANRTWQHYIQFVVLLTGVFSSRCWTAMISLALYWLNCRSLCFVLRVKFWLFFFAFGLPLFGTGLLLLIGSHHMKNEVDPAFHYGENQTVMSLIIMLLCSCINITCLVLRQRNSRQLHRLNESTKLASDSSDTERLIKSTECQHPCGKSAANLLDDIDENGGGDIGKYRSSENCVSCRSHANKETNIEDIISFPDKGKSKESTTSVPLPSTSSCSSSSSDLYDSVDERTCLTDGCSAEQRQRCVGLIRSYNATVSTTISVDVEAIVQDEVSLKPPLLKDEYQSNRFVILLLCMQLSMFIGIFLCTWRLFNHETSGIYMEIEFLDSVFNYGQAIITFAVFGFDTRLMIIPFIKKWRKCMYGAEVVHVPRRAELKDDSALLCEQFVTYHKDNCGNAIVRDLNYQLRTYEAVFTGTDLCDWLLRVGLARDRGEAVNYGKTLLVGQVICHVSKEHNFHDMPYFYRFMSEEETS